ncbi:MAG: PDZ domain-containing protein, partial [Fluviicola sp.]|nr:PDZ domain-containing protein [Fluviicola sp.]
DAVTEGKTAMKAGLEAGDIIIKIGKFKIKDIYDYMECLSKLEKGDTITITVKRKESIIKKKVKLL